MTRLFPCGALPVLLRFRQAARVGSIKVGDTAHKAVLVENDTDGLFSKPASNADEAKKTRPVWLLVDLKDDGKFASGPIDIRGTFALDGHNYDARVSSDGEKLKLIATTKAVAELTPKAPPLLASGTPAPEFTAQKWGGGDLKLSDYRGKVVILDFWATWCPPCKASMPHLEKVHQEVKDKGVVVLGVCSWDEKAAYEKWVQEHQTQYTFLMALDSAEKRREASVATKLYHVPGLPTTYIIGADGKVAASMAGYGEGDTRLEEALKKLGIDVASEARPTTPQ